jgi:hypothetical protein
MAANWTAFVSGAVLEASQLNGVVDNFADIAIFNETQAAGTNGGSSVATTWTKRVLNTTNVNNIAGCSIASSVITLAAGTYTVEASATFFNVGFGKLKLRNTTDSTTTLIGNSNNFGGSTGTAALLVGSFTIAASKNFELQYYVQAATATNGLGVASGGSESEVYGILKVTRIA